MQLTWDEIMQSNVRSQDKYERNLHTKKNNGIIKYITILTGDILEYYKII